MTVKEPSGESVNIITSAEVYGRNIRNRAGRPRLLYGQMWFKESFDWLTDKQAANLSTHFSHRWERMTPDARKVILNTYWRSQPCLNELRSCSNALTKTIHGPKPTGTPGKLRLPVWTAAKDFPTTLTGCR